MMASDQNTATQASSGDAVNPCNRIIIIPALAFKHTERVIQIFRSGLLHDHVRTFYWRKSECDLRYYPGESHSPNRGPEQFSTVVRRAMQTRAVGADNFQLINVLAKRSSAMMILPVDIRSDTATD